MFEVRHNGAVVLRAETQEEADEAAKRMGEDFSVRPGGRFELHTKDGFATSFDSESEAQDACTKIRNAGIHEGPHLIDLEPPPPTETVEEAIESLGEDGGSIDPFEDPTPPEGEQTYDPSADEALKSE